MKDTNTILTYLVDTLKIAKQGLDDLLNGPTERRSSGIKNFTIWARAVTNVLQNLRSTEPDFENWYQPYRVEMEKDPLMKFFYNNRTAYLKQGQFKVARIVENLNINSFEFLKKNPPPKYAKEFFMGDENGGAGWILEMPDGTTEKIYYELPEENGTTNIEFLAPPNSHLGNELVDLSINNLCQLNYNYLKSMVDEALKKFKK